MDFFTYAKEILHSLPLWRLTEMTKMVLRKKALVQFTSVQFKMVSMRLGRPIWAPHHLSGVSPMLPLETVPMLA